MSADSPVRPQSPRLSHPNRTRRGATTRASRVVQGRSANPAAPHATLGYDALDRPVATGLYSGTQSEFTTLIESGGDPRTLTTNRLGLRSDLLDSMGRPYQRLEQMGAIRYNAFGEPEVLDPLDIDLDGDVDEDDLTKMDADTDTSYPHTANRWADYNRDGLTDEDEALIHRTAGQDPPLPCTGTPTPPKMPGKPGPP